MAHRPVGVGFSTAIASGSATQSSSFSVQSDTLRLVAVGAGAHVAIGTNPTASISDYYIASGTESTLSLSIASQKVSGITTGSTTIIDFPQGTGSPFVIGDYVSFISVNQPYYNFTHAPVISVNNSASYDGYFSTRIVVDTNTSGIVTSFSTDGDLRKSLKVSNYGTGTGTLYIQQVQISGNA
jgi:hypothetical protein